MILLGLQVAKRLALTEAVEWQNLAKAGTLTGAFISSCCHDFVIALRTQLRFVQVCLRKVVSYVRLQQSGSDCPVPRDCLATVLRAVHQFEFLTNSNSNSSATGTDSDLRKLGFEESGLVLQKFGIPKAEIAGITNRWSRIDLVRKMCTQVRAGSGNESK